MVSALERGPNSVRSIPRRSCIVSEVRQTHSRARIGRDHFEELEGHVQQIDVFEEVDADLRHGWPSGMRHPAPYGLWSAVQRCAACSRSHSAPPGVVGSAIMSGATWRAASLTGDNIPATQLIGFPRWLVHQVATPDSENQRPNRRLFEDRRQGDEFKAALPWLVVLFLAAFVMFYLSRPDSVELERRARTVVGEIKNVPEPDIGLVLREFQAEENESVWRTICQHISHALFVACFLILAVEIRARRVARKDMNSHVDLVTKSVFEGISQRLLGESISTELRDILREDFVKQRAGYQLTFERMDDSSTWVIVKQETWFDVRNLTREVRKFPFSTSLLGYNRQTVNIDGKPVEFPHFVEAKFNDEEQDLNGLYDGKDPNHLSLRRLLDCPVDSDKPLKTKVIARVLYRSQDSVVFSSSYGMEESEVIVANQIARVVASCDAVVLHKHTEQVVPRSSGHWEFKRALLPGQGWYVYWEDVKRADDKQAVKTPAVSEPD
jgi:hypothetical protein